jgi:hypothetical protein
MKNEEKHDQEVKEYVKRESKRQKGIKKAE